MMLVAGLKPRVCDCCSVSRSVGRRIAVDGQAFNAMTRSLATRRVALARVSKAGLGAMVLSLLGRGVLAQTDTPEPTCEAELVASVRLGPSANTDLGAD